METQLDKTIKLPKYKHEDGGMWLYNDLIRNENITSLQLKVYELIYSFSSIFEEIFLSQKTIANKLNISLPTLRKALNELKEIGLFKITKRKGHTSIYELVPYEKWSKVQLKGKTFIPNAILLTENLSTNELRLYQVLKSFSKMKAITPSKNNLARYCGNVSVQTIWILIKSLKEKNLIDYERNIEICKGDTYNEYFIFDEDVWLKEYGADSVLVSPEQNAPENEEEINNVANSNGQLHKKSSRNSEQVVNDVVMSREEMRVGKVLCPGENARKERNLKET